MAVLAGVDPLGGVAFAATSNDTSNVSVNVTATTKVTISPGLYNFSSIQVGETNFTDHSQLQMVITNEGSSNITDIYAHPNTIDAEPDNPLGTGVAAEYAAGRFLWIKNESSQWYHAGVLSWNITSAAGGWPAGVTYYSNDDWVSTGYYRNATGDYLWALSGNGTDSHTGNIYCNTTTASDDTTAAPQIDIKTVADTGDNRDLTDSGTTTSYTLDTVQSGTDPNWTMTSSTVDSGPLQGHYVAAYETCEKFYAFRFDDAAMWSAATSGEANLPYLVSDELTPGSTHTGRVGAAIPQGIPAGTTNQTELTIFASSVSN